jgi:hypothetical protein
MHHLPMIVGRLPEPHITMFLFKKHCPLSYTTKINNSNMFTQPSVLLNEHELTTFCSTLHLKTFFKNLCRILLFVTYILTLENSVLQYFWNVKKLQFVSMMPLNKMENLNCYYISLFNSNFKCTAQKTKCLSTVNAKEEFKEPCKCVKQRTLFGQCMFIMPYMF